ncbi:MAG TPA: tetratricopeptide repeat protein, partial [Candidatus Latescibacteria bacterium]|nr:tetratricopeptide repeat protein [Candidatus Latescibacterota bacterium]
ELRQRGQYAQAIEAFSEAIRLRPDFADAYNGRGVARNHEGGRVRYMSDDPPRRREEAERLWRDAVADFREAIRLNPRESGYWVNLMISFQLLNDTQEAQQAREQALQIDEELRPVLEDIFRTGQ